MKKLLCLLILLLPVTAFAEEQLYPAIDENGLWGYINAQAEWIIAPQFDGAGEFRGDYATVMVYPEGFVPDPDDPMSLFGVPCEGIIDRSGAFVLEPIAEYIDPGYDGGYYGGKDTGIWVISTADGEGFFDIPSGYCSSFDVWVWPWVSDSRLIPVNGGYMDRTNGEMVIKGDFYEVDPGCFHDGIVAASYTDMKGEPIKFFMMDEKGNVIRLPDGVSTVYAACYSDGRMVVVDKNERYGYADGEGNIVIPMQYKYASDFSEGYAEVEFFEGDCGFIDVDGNVLARGFTWTCPFRDGYAKVGLSGTTKQDSVTGFINWQGEIVPFMDSDHFAAISEERIWKSLGGGFWDSVLLLDSQGNVLTTEAYELPEYDYPYFAEGLQAVGTADGWGYINPDGKVVIPLQFTCAWNFDGELASVRMGNQRGYIDKSGNVVYMWDSPID